MDEQDEKILNTLQFCLVFVLIIIALKMCNESEQNTNIESCKPIGCVGE